VQALSREAAGTLLDGLRRDYDAIVIDGCPIVPAADALVLAQRADTVVLSLLAGVSRMPTAYAAWQRLTSLGVRVLGAVVHGAADATTAEHVYTTNWQSCPPIAPESVNEADPGTYCPDPWS